MMGINESYLDTLVIILSILGGVFGGIPAIIKWISRPRFRIKYFKSYDTVINFTIANEGLLSKDATELEIKCLLQNEDEEKRIEKGYFSNDPIKLHIEEENKPILIDGLPRGASTNTLFFRSERKFPDDFRFFIFLKCREGKAILSRKYPLRRQWLFCWDEVPGNDRARLIEFLIKEYSNFDWDWIRTAQIEKGADNKRINISDGVNLISLKLSDDGKNVYLVRKDKYDSGASTYVDFHIAKIEKGKLNIYCRKEV